MTEGMAATVVTGHVAGLAVIRSLGEMGVPVDVVGHDDKEFGHASRYVRDVSWAEHPEDREDDFIDHLVARARRRGRSLLLPTSDEALVAVSRRREELEPHYLVACPPWDVTRRFIDKRFTYELAERLGIRSPRTALPNRNGSLRALADRMGYPCLLKPRQGHRYFAEFGRKMAVVHDERQLEEEHERAADAGMEMLLQELIPGPDTHGVNYNVYFRDGKALAACTAQKLRLSPPGTGRPRAVMSRNIPELAEPSHALLEGLGFEGFACVEFKRDARDGEYTLMEVNGRHNLSSLLSTRSGVNFPWLIYEHLVHGRRPPRCESVEGLYWVDPLADVVQTVRHAPRERYRPVEIVRPYARRPVYATFDRADPRPTAVRLARLVRGGRGRTSPKAR